jgi:hypothetical protein
MNFQDIPSNILTIRMKLTDSSATLALKEQPVFSVEPNRTRPGEFEIRLRNSVVFAQPAAEADIRRLDLELASGRAMLAQLANPAADGSIELQIAFFTGECLEMGEIEIGVDEYVEDTIARLEHRKNKLKGDGLHKRLSQLCCFQQGGREFFFLIAGPAIDGMLKTETEREENGQDKVREPGATEDPEDSSISVGLESDLDDGRLPQKPQPNRKNSFCVTGDEIRFVATETPDPDGGSIFTVTRLTQRKGGADRALRLATGRLTFVDWTRVGRIRAIAKAQMAALTGDEGSYLKKWDEFGDLEGEMLLEHAREVDAIQYGNMEQHRDGTVTVRILHASDSALKALHSGDVPAVELVEQIPVYLENKSLTFKDFTCRIEQEEDDKKARGRRPGQQDENRRFDVLRYDATSKTLTLASESLPTGSGTFILSLAGDIAQIKRRMQARRSILEGRSANPQLGLLIEQGGRIAATRPPRRIQPLTAFVRNKVFQEAPTVMQERAIDVALNTPDIAIIQGPPGTGKTTVIAAILERLNEMADKRKATIKGQVLLTGFQHDAVENMIGRLSLNGIPFVPKYGKRSGSQEDGFSAFERNLEEWCRQLAAELRERNPQIDEIERESAVRNLCLQYIQAPTRALAVELVDRIATLGVAILGEAFMHRTTSLAGHFASEGQSDDRSDRQLYAARRLRVRTETFADDGPERATDALDDLRDVLDEGERALLDAASLWRREDGEPPFLDDLAKLKKGLLLRLTAPPIFRVEKHNDEVIALAEQAINRIRDAGLSSKDRRSAALAEFLSELESNLNGMRDAISDYSFAFAATCQQSVNRQMQRQKGITGDDPDQQIEYEYVIVDEAARVSPRDLMIPMAQGKRIILVGDHRQLPHLVDEDVIERLSEDDAEDLLARETTVEHDQANWSKISMFEHMFIERLPELEELDKITRCVTLDTQYRMHPLLGDFVSRNFYERFNKKERFKSGRPASDFSHDLPGTDGKAAIWLDVPASKGKHQRSGTSWTRPAEATVIAHQLRDWMKSASGLCSSLNLSEEDFFDIESFASKLQERERPIDDWLASQLSSDTRTKISAYLQQNGSLTELRDFMKKDLEKVISQVPVFDIDRFEGVALRVEIRDLLKESPQGNNMVRLNRLLLEDAYPLHLRRRPLSFGVISFYKAQAELIRKQLGGITNDDKRLRIGTVDSFQGMEFDVVFLSMVRTIPEAKFVQAIKAKTGEKGEAWTDEMEARVSFGHLCLYNRLNVSMSRQKKLLVVAGDSSLLKSALAEKFIPGLVDFLELCETERRDLPCH